MEVQLQFKQFCLIILLVICTTQTLIGQKKNECHLDNTCLNDGSCECDSNYTKTSCGKNICESQFAFLKFFLQCGSVHNIDNNYNSRLQKIIKALRGIAFIFLSSIITKLLCNSLQ